MPAIIPTIIQGPAILIHDTKSYYFKDGLTLEHSVESFNVGSDMHGQIDERFLRDVVRIRGTPDGQLSDIAKYFPFAVTDIGADIFGAGTDKTVVIHTKAGQTITYPKGRITKSPQLRLKVSDTIFGDMEFTCLGKSATQRTDPAYWKTIASAAFADATFNETKINTGPYTATYGLTPYDSMGSMDGFLIDLAYQVTLIGGEDVGYQQGILAGMTATASFKPSNLTEAQIDTLLNVQGVSARQPGQSLAKSDTDLVIASTFFSATIHKAGPKDARSVYATGKHRHEGVAWTSKRTFTVGVPNALFTFTIL